jgi:hypothetical protein
MRALYSIKPNEAARKSTHKIGLNCDYLDVSYYHFTILGLFQLKHPTSTTMKTYDSTSLPSFKIRQPFKHYEE